MIKQINGNHIINDFDAPASTAFDFNDVVTRDSNGSLAKATASTPRSELLGLIQQTIASTDDDYASVKTVPVLEFHDGAEFLADVDTGTLTVAMRGLRYDLNDEDGIDVTSQGQKAVEVVRFISTTQARVKFVTEGDRMELKSYQETISVADFTDGGGATGTLALGITIPAGAVYAQTLVTGVVGFAGDTSATFQLGDGTDADRYSTGTPSVFATAVAGADAGVPSGTKFHSAAKTPTVTVTTATDFGLTVTDGNGAMVVTLFWYEAN
jgi:hypothetical protein